jgi:hypothetical protein
MSLGAKRLINVAFEGVQIAVFSTNDAPGSLTSNLGFRFV